MSENDIENWANAIEGREDIGYERGRRNLIKDVIFDLANPELSEEMSEKFARKLVRKLSKR